MKKKFYLALIIFSLVGQIAWVIENMYFNVFIYKMFNASASDISLMVALSAIMAALTTIFIGALSDKLGKRKAFMVVGYLLWGLSITSFALIDTNIISKIFVSSSITAVGVTLVIIMDCVMTFFGSSANDACFNAWLTDSTTEGERGKAEGINSMMPLVAILVVFGSFMSFDTSKSSSWQLIFIIIGVVVIITSIIGIFIINEAPIEVDNNKNYFKNVFYGFKPSVIKENKKLYIDLIIFMLFNVAIQIFMPYLIIYYQVTLKLDNYVLIMAPAIILAAIFTFFYGRIYDKKGFNFTILISLIIGSIGFIVLYIFKNTILVFIGSLFMMMGYLSGMSIFGARIRDNTPKNKSGSFQGLRIIFQVLLPGVIGPAIGALVLKNADMITNDDGTTSFIPNQNIFLFSLLVIILVILIIGITILINKNKKESKES